MPKHPWLLIVLTVCALMISSCATRPVPLPVAPPQLAIPPEVTQPCDLPQLGKGAVLADLEVAYVERGRALVACDLARQSGYDTLVHERRLIALWQAKLAGYRQ